jgi:hypothetical protein
MSIDFSKRWQACSEHFAHGVVRAVQKRRRKRRTAPPGQA